MRTHNGEVRLNDRVDRIDVRRGAIESVRLSPSDEQVGCHFVLSSLPVSRLGRLLSDRSGFDSMLDTLGQPRPAYFRYTLNAVLEREALPEGMARDVLPQLTRAENAAEKAWRAGAISYMEWAQLQAMRIEARQRQLDAAIAAQTALIEIQRLTGQSMLAAGDTPATAAVSTEDRR